MKKYVKVFVSVIILGLCTSASGVIDIEQVSDLDFGRAFLGDRAKRITDVNAETSENASFRVTGDRGRTFSVTLPNNMWINHSSSGDRLRVQRFRLSPRRLSIGNSGERMIYVSATRNRIPTGISPGLYSGTFTVTVVY